MLVSKIRGIEEILPYKYKYFISSQNPSTISNQLLELIDDKEYFSYIFKTQQKKIDELFSYNSVNKKLLEIIEE